MNAGEKFFKNNTSKQMSDKSQELSKRFEDELAAIFMSLCQNYKVDLDPKNENTTAIVAGITLAFTAGYEIAMNEN